MPKKTMTPAQLAANAANAKKSTGPITPEGKAAVARNAVTHGLTARTIVLERDGLESIEDFESLLTALRRDLAPAGHLEELLVERIAAAHWRLRRAWRFENRSIQELRKSNADSLAEVGRRMAGLPAFDPNSVILPASKDLEKLIRYEVTLDRQLHRCLLQLSRLQARRQTAGPPATTDNTPRTPDDDREKHIFTNQTHPATMAAPCDPGVSADNQGTRKNESTDDTDGRR